MSTTCSVSAEFKKYCVTRGVYDGVLRAAQKAITAPNGLRCTSAQLAASGRSQITLNRLVSMMLAIPAWELKGGDTKIALSPMALSRSDNMVVRNDSNNIALYSHMTLGGYKRAHWNPGVGLWQLDDFENSMARVDALRFSHAERADVDKGGFEVAKYLRYSYCRNWNPFDSWFACDNNQCQATHSVRYSAATDSVAVQIVEELTDPTGGVQERLCRWGDEDIELACFVYDLGLKEGYSYTCCVLGTHSAATSVNSPYTPEAAPFISFTDSETYPDIDTKFAVWPKVWPSTGLIWPSTTAKGVGETAKTIIRAVRVDESARFSPYNGNKNGDGIAYHDLEKRDGETLAAYEARIQARVVVLNGGPLTVNNSSVKYGLSNGGAGPEGWFDSLVNGRDLQLYNCVGSAGDKLEETCWVSTNGDG